MELTEAITLIKRGFTDSTSKRVWADLGCGSGLFTKAVAALIGNGKIFAVDREIQHIQRPENSNVEIEFLKLDFIVSPFPFIDVDGILMANSLHYVNDKVSFIEKMKLSLKPDGRVIIVEYDTEQANQWVPYPLSFEKLKRTFYASGFGGIEKIGEKKSLYRSGKMYACSIRQ